MLFGFFCFNKKTYIKKLGLSRSMGEDVNSLLVNQRRDFFFDHGEVIPVEEFYPGSPVSDAVISTIEYDDPEGFSKAVASPSSYSLCNEDDLPYLVAIFAENPENSNEILIQLIEKKRLLLPKSGWLAFKKISEGEWKDGLEGVSDSNSFGTFVEMADLGLQLDNKLTAVYDGSKLYFKSYFQANKIFDLSEYLATATDDTVKEFLKLECISDGGNLNETMQLFTSSQRRKVAKVMALGFAKRYSAHEITQRAQKAKKNIQIEMENGKIKIPAKASDRAVLLQFLSNGIMASYLDDENDYAVESTRPVK